MNLTSNLLDVGLRTSLYIMNVLPGKSDYVQPRSKRGIYALSNGGPGQHLLNMSQQVQEAIRWSSMSRVAHLYFSLMAVAILLKIGFNPIKYPVKFDVKCKFRSWPHLLSPHNLSPLFSPMWQYLSCFRPYIHYR